MDIIHSWGKEVARSVTNQISYGAIKSQIDAHAKQQIQRTKTLKVRKGMSNHYLRIPNRRLALLSGLFDIKKVYSWNNPQGSKQS